MSDATRMVYIVDDDAMVRRSLAFFLGSVGFATRTFGSGRELIEVMPGLAPGCVLLDIRMSEMHGLQVLELLGPQLDRLPVVVMTGHGDVGTAVRAMKLGARDFVEKPYGEEDLLATLDQVFAMLAEATGRASRCAQARGLIDRLTPREREVLDGLLVGHANKEIAYQLGLSVRTVEMHRASMMERLNVRSLGEALRLAYLAGIGGLAVEEQEPAAA